MSILVGLHIHTTSPAKFKPDDLRYIRNIDWLGAQL